MKLITITVLVLGLFGGSLAARLPNEEYARELIDLIEKRDEVDDGVEFFYF